MSIMDTQKINGIIHWIKTQKFWTSVIVAIIITGLTGCQPSVETKTVTVTTPTTTITTTVSGIPWLDIPIYHSHYSDSKTITIDVGEEFAIALYSTPMPGGGSLWYETHDANMLYLLANKYLDHATALKSRAGDQYIIFKTLQQGSTQITFVYRQSHPESEVLEEKVFNIKIETDEPTSLSQNQQLWNSKNISDYSYHLQVGTGFRPPRTADVIVTVQDGVATGYDVVGEPENPNPDDITPYDTFDKMFDLLKQAYGVEGDQVDVTYDPTYGFPTWSASYSKTLGLDTHFAITISDFITLSDSAPQLISPEPGAVLDNSPGSPNAAYWNFDWTDIEGATQYHIYIKYPPAVNPTLDKNNITESSFRLGFIGTLDSHYGWTWKVRALVDGVWSEWSETQTFDVEFVNIN